MSVTHPQLKSGFIEINPDNTCALYSADIGLQDSEDADVFYFNILTPSGLAAELEKHPKLFGKGYLFMPFISENIVKKEIENILSKISGVTWDDIAEKISRYGNWEFEDYEAAHG